MPRTIIALAHSLNLEVVAEGVEEVATLNRLVDLGCDFAQGYLWAPALPPEEFVEFVQSRVSPPDVHRATVQLH